MSAADAAPAADASAKSAPLMSFDDDPVMRRVRDTQIRCEETLKRADQTLVISTSELELKWQQFQDLMKRLNQALVSRLETMAGPMAGAGGGFGYAGEIEGVPDHVLWHGHLGRADWPAPTCTLKSAAAARPGYCETIDKSEYVDAPQVLSAKVDLLCAMLRSARRDAAGAGTFYAGAGISTNLPLLAEDGKTVLRSGIPDYASSTAGSSGVTEQTKSNKMTKDFLRRCLPSTAHRVATALVKAGYCGLGVLSANHDGLFHRAGLDSRFVNEIHGSCWDASNPIVPMSGQLRTSNGQWMMKMVRESKLVITLGTSLSGMQSDGIVRAVARRFLVPASSTAKAASAPPTAASVSEAPSSKATASAAAARSKPRSRSPTSATAAELPPFNAERGLGVVIINIQRTQLDSMAALRIFARLDDVFDLVAKRMAADGVAVDTRTYEYPGNVYQYVDPILCKDGRPAPDERPEVAKNVRLSRIVNRLSPEHRAEILRKLEAKLVTPAAVVDEFSHLSGRTVTAPAAAATAAAPAAAASVAAAAPPSVGARSPAVGLSFATPASAAAGNPPRCAPTPSAPAKAAAAKRSASRSPPQISSRSTPAKSTPLSRARSSSNIGIDNKRVQLPAAAPPKRSNSSVKKS